MTLRPNWPRLRVQALRALSLLRTRDGIVAACAISVVFVTAWIALIAVPAERHAVASEREAATIERRKALRSIQAGRKDAAPADAALAFAAAFPGAQSRPERVARLIELAQRHGLAWKRTEYAYRPETTLALSRYQLVMPVTGSYESVRVFIAESLSQDDALSLDGLRIQRADSRSVEVQAELRFTLFARVDATQATPSPDQRSTAGDPR